MDKEFEGGWQEMRHDAERLSKEIKKRFWGLESNAMYGIHYDDYADILFDLHRVLRHQLWFQSTPPRGGRLSFQLFRQCR